MATAAVSEVLPGIQKLHPVSVDAYQAIFLHLSQFAGQGAAFDVEVVGQLLSVQRQGKSAAPVENGLIGEI